MGAEYELKFRADGAAQDALREAFPGNWTCTTMQTTYYDTPSGSLSAKRYMLRSRLENGTCVCTLKTPGTGNVRGEWEAESTHITAAVSELCKLDVPDDLEVICAEGLLPICGAEFVRQATLLELPDFSAELALDKGILLGGGKECSLCEVELELKAGSAAALDAFAASLAAEYGLQTEEKSKFARALALYKEG